MMGSREGSATQPPSLRPRRQIQSPAEQDEPARQRGDQREPLTSQEDFTPKREAAGEGCGHQEDREQDPESVVPVTIPGETDQDAQQSITDEDRRRHDAPNHPSEAARPTSECSMETFDSANLCDGGLRRQPSPLENVRVHGEVILPEAQADIGFLRCRASPGSSAEPVPPSDYAGSTGRCPRNRTETRDRRKPKAVIPSPAKITK